MKQTFTFLCFFFFHFLTAQNPELVIQAAHQEPVLALSASPDGEYIASSSEDKTIKLWQVRSGKQVRSFNDRMIGACKLWFSNDSKWLFSKGKAGDFHVWNMNDGSEFFDYKDYQNELTLYLACSPDSKQILSVTQSQLLRIYDIQQKKIVYKSPQAMGTVVGVSFSAAGIFIVLDDGSYRILDKNFKLSVAQKLIPSKLSAYDSDGMHKAFATIDGRVIVLDSAFKTLKTFNLNGGKAYDLRFSPRKGVLLADKNMGMIKGKAAMCILDLKGPDAAVTYKIAALTENWTASSENFVSVEIQNAGKNSKITAGARSPVLAAIASPDARVLYTAHMDGSLSMWNVNNSELLKSMGVKLEALISAGMEDSSGMVIGVYEDRVVHINTATLAMKTLNAPGQISAAAFDASGRLYISTGSGFHYLQGQKWRESKLELSNASAFFISEKEGEETWIASGFGNGRVEISSLDNESIASIPEIGSYIIGLAISPNRDRVALISENELIIWDLKLKKKLRSFSQKDEVFASVAFSGDGAYVALLSRSKTIYMFDALKPMRQHLMMPNKQGYLVMSMGSAKKQSFPLCFMPGSNVIAYAGENSAVCLRNDETKDFTQLTGHSNFIRSMFWTRDEKLITSSDDGSIRLWDCNKSTALTIVPTGKNSVLFSTHEGYYYNSQGDLRSVAFRMNGKAYPLEQFDLLYNRPDIVLKALNRAEPDLINAYKAAWEKRIKRAGLNASNNASAGLEGLPECSIQQVAKLPQSVSLADFSFKVNIKAGSKKPSRLLVQINNVLVQSTALAAADKEKALKLKLCEGRNKIRISVMDESGRESLPEYCEVYLKSAQPVAPVIYFFGVGVSNYANTDFNLTYAAKDIRDICSMLGKSKYKLVVDTLMNEAVKRESILAFKARLRKSRPDDIVIIAFSGHGLLSSDLDFYFATHDMNFSEASKRGIKIADIESLLDSIPARRKLLLLDACHSGELDRELAKTGAPGSTVKVIPGSRGAGSVALSGSQGKGSFELMQELFNNISQSNGSVVLSAAGGKQYALESGEWNNGVFTYCVISCLRDRKGDSNGDGIISITELKNYVYEQVPLLTGGRQVPTARRDNLDVDWSLW